MRCTERAIRGRDDCGNFGVHVRSTGSSSEAAVRSEVGAAGGELDAVFDAPVADCSKALTLGRDRELRKWQEKERQKSIHATNVKVTESSYFMPKHLLLASGMAVRAIGESGVSCNLIPGKIVIAVDPVDCVMAFLDDADV